MGKDTDILKLQEMFDYFSKNALSPISDDNIFYILNKEWDERMHCRVLLFLIKHYPAEFAENFLSNCDGFNGTDFELSTDESYCEFPCNFIKGCKYFDGKNKHGFIDILLVWKNKSTDETIYMPIEVKLYAGDQPLQLIRYYYHFSHNGYTVRPVYLTLDSKYPSENSISCKYDCDKCPKKNIENEVIRKSFRDIENWLKKINAKDETSTALIKHYKELLERWYKMNEYNEYIMKGRDKFNIAKNIYNSFPSLREEILKTFFDKITECAGDVGDVIFDYDNRSKAKDDGWADANNIKSILEFDNNYLAVCVGDNLYCRRNKSDSDDDKNIEEWSYITKEWFKSKDVSKISEDTNVAINCKKLTDDNNYIVEWYYKDINEKNRDIANLVKNLRRYAKHEF